MSHSDTPALTDRRAPLKPILSLLVGTTGFVIAGTLAVSAISADAAAGSGTTLFAVLIAGFAARMTSQGFQSLRGGNQPD